MESGLRGTSPATLPGGMGTERAGSLTITVFVVSRESLDGERMVSMPNSAIILASFFLRRNLNHTKTAKTRTSTEPARTFVSLVRQARRGVCISLPKKREIERPITSGLLQTPLVIGFPSLYGEAVRSHAASA